MQSMNPAMVMVLVPLMLWLYPRMEKMTGIRVSPLRRMGTGMVLGGGLCGRGFLQTRVDGGANLSVLWQTLPYSMLTTGEVLLSTTGLEFAFTQAAAETEEHDHEFLAADGRLRQPDGASHHPTQGPVHPQGGGHGRERFGQFLDLLSLCRADIWGSRLFSC